MSIGHPPGGEDVSCPEIRLMASVAAARLGLLFVVEVSSTISSCSEGSFEGVDVDTALLWDDWCILCLFGYEPL